ncbi:hypothetical protein Hypma_005160 [Hypsizygus marmoreus]|uniref:Uncharacterized protein n=1 Tax=Hypsizygus marmoreus TaxID=39966 RepID=A0A369K5N5_HYPMA|nr:hypothetical protein Hypma_005160 [Hypsizygus marmoreus]
MAEQRSSLNVIWEFLGPAERLISSKAIDPTNSDLYLPTWFTVRPPSSSYRESQIQFQDTHLKTPLALSTLESLSRMRQVLDHDTV